MNRRKDSSIDERERKKRWAITFEGETPKTKNG